MSCSRFCTQRTAGLSTVDAIAPITRPRMVFLWLLSSFDELDVGAWRVRRASLALASARLRGVAGFNSHLRQGLPSARNRTRDPLRGRVTKGSGNETLPLTPHWQWASAASPSSYHFLENIEKPTYGINNLCIRNQFDSLFFEYTEEKKIIRGDPIKISMRVQPRGFYFSSRIEKGGSKS